MICLKKRRIELRAKARKDNVICFRYVLGKKKADAKNTGFKKRTEGGARTLTLLLARDFESRVSTNSTTSAIQYANFKDGF